MKRRGLRGHYAAVEPEINVTPLVDVVLVLLIIFMVVVPQMQKERPVELPRVYHADPEHKATLDPWSLTVVRSGEIYFGEQRLHGEEIPDVLFGLRQSDPNRRVVVRADAGVAWSKVREVLASVQQAGFPGASLLVNQRKASAGDPPEGG
jgi:biopolymer transport protein ExbD/biopolymer transport protein TolR